MYINTNNNSSNNEKQKNCVQQFTHITDHSTINVTFRLLRSRQYA